MTIQDIECLIANVETKAIELKKTTGELKEAMHTACAFLNSDGGWLIFGIAPGSLKILGQQVSDATRQEIAQALTGIEPTIEVDVQYIDVPDRDGCKVIAMHFDEYVRGSVPYCYHGCPYYKVESITKQMPRELYDLRIKESNPLKFAWDTKVADGITVDDLDEDRIRTAVRLGIAGGRINPTAEGETVESLLSKLKLLVDGKPTNAAVALFAKNTDNYPQLLLRMACFKGKDKNEFIDNKRVTGNFFDLLDAGIQFCFRHLNLSGRIVGLQREEHLEIPMEALREGLTNALCHRLYDNPSASVSLAIYSDRIEIVNPGTFPEDITAESIMLPHDSYPRNLRIAQVLYQTTNLESWGSGVKRMVELCKAQDIPTPYYEEGKNSITLIFPKLSDTSNVGKDIGKDVGKDVGKELSERQEVILQMIRKNSTVSAREMSEKMSVNERTIERDLAKLVDMGCIYRTGGKKQGNWVLMS